MQQKAFILFNKKFYGRNKFCNVVSLACLFLSSLIFAGKVGAYPSGAPNQTMSRFLAFFRNRLRWKRLKLSNTLAYDGKEFITNVEVLLHIPKANVIKYFTAVIYECLL